MSEERVRVDIADGVATATMVRGDKHNALDPGMFNGLIDASERLATEPGVRAVVLCGDGPSFCAGLDFASFMGGGMTIDDMLDRPDGELANFAQSAVYNWSLIPAPVIAAVHGNALGGGFQVALGADIRIVAPDARLSVLEIKWGLVPDMGITQSLPRLVGIDVAKELTFTGRVLSGEEAAGLGVATRVADDPLAAAQELAAEIASKSPHAIRHAKRLYDESWNASPADALVLETELQRELLGSPNQMAAVTAGMTKQPAQFEDVA